MAQNRQLANLMDATTRPWWFTRQEGDLTEFPEVYSPISQMGLRHFIRLPDGSEAVVFVPEGDEIQPG